MKSIFQSSSQNSVISKDQVQILRNWNNAVAHGCTNQETFNRIIANADDNTKMYFAGLNKGKGSIEGLKNAQNVAKQSTVGLTIAQTALNMAISMGLMAAISLAIKGFDKLINSAKRASEAADEAFSDTNEKVQKNEEKAKSLDELISKYKELKENGNLDIDGRKEVKELQNDIADLVGTQAKNLDLVNGKLDDEIKKLDEISAKEAKNAYETSIANYNNSKKANEEATGDESFLFVDGYSYVGKREKDVEKILKDAGFTNIQSGGFFGSKLFVRDDFNNNTEELKGAQEKADYLQSMIDVLEQNGQRATDLYAGLIKQRDAYLKYIDNQQNAANSLVNSWITYSQFSNEELSKINVDSVESFDTYRQKMIEEAKNDESIGKILADGTLSDEDLEKAVNDFMSTSLNFSEWYEQWLGNIQNQNNSNETDISLPDTETLEQQISDLNSAIDSIQSAYDTLNSAVEEYNSNGGTLSIDTIQSLLSLSNEYLACLQVENGQLSLNADAMNALAQSKLDEAQATAVTQAMTELQAIANGEAAQSTTNYISGNAALMSSLAQLSGSYEGVAQAAMTAAQAQKLSAFISNASAKDKTATENVMKGLDTKLKLIQSTQNKIKSSGLGFSKKSSASKAAPKAASKAAKKTAEDIQKEWKEYLDKYLAMYKAELDAGLIDFNTFLNKSRSLLDEFYRDRKISAKDYWDSVKSLYENQLSIYDKVLSAVTRRIEKEVDGIQDIIDGLEEQNDALQKQLDEYDSILSVVDEVYEKQIQALEDEKELLQDKIDAINDTNDALDLQYRKEEAIYALRRAQEQRTKKVFNGKEFVYTTDNEVIRDAQQTLQDIETEELINNLEREQEALDVEIEKLEEFKEKWAEITNAYDEEINRQLAIALWGKDYEKIILSNRLSDIESFKNEYISIQRQINSNEELINSYNEKVDYYNKLKEQWSSITDAYKQAQENQYAAQLLGAQWERDVLSGRIDILNNFKNQYIAIQQAITNAALEAARAQAVAQSSQSSGSGGGGGGGSSYSGGSSTNSGNEKILHLQRFMNQVFGSNLTEDGIMGSKTKKAIKHMQLLIGANQTGVYDKATYDKLKYYVGKTLRENDKRLYNIARSLGYPKYAKGTTNAKKGVALVSEKEHGDEIIIDNNDAAYVAEGEQLHYFEGGETVIKASESEKILTNMENLTPLQDYVSPFSGMNLQPIDYSSMVMSSLNLPDFSKLATVNRDNSTSVSIGEIHLHEVNNVDSFANAIIRELPNKISQKLG